MVRRYLLIKIISAVEMTDRQFRETLELSVKTCFGEFGFARIDPRILGFDPGAATAIVSCQRSAVAELETSLALTTEYAGQEIAILVAGISGTIKGIKRHLR